MFTFDNNFNGFLVNVTGYPGISPNPALGGGNDVLHTNQWSMMDQIAIGTPSTLNLQSPVASGFSGGPTWYETKDNKARVVGITDADTFPTLFGARIPFMPANGAFSIGVGSIPIKPGIAALINSVYRDPPSDDGRITSAVVLQTGDADTGQTVQFVLNLSENVVISGTGPTLRLNDGGTATYNAAASAGTELEFDYTVGADDQTSNPRGHAGRCDADRASSRRRQYRLFGARQSADTAFHQLATGRAIDRKFANRRGRRRATSPIDADDERIGHGQSRRRRADPSLERQ